MSHKWSWQSQTCNCRSCRGDGPDDPEECPDSCHSMQVVYSECGGIGACECFPKTLRGRLALWWQGPCEIDPEPECDCLSPEEIKADRAEARAEAREDR